MGLFSYFKKIREKKERQREKEKQQEIEIQKEEKQQQKEEDNFFNKQEIKNIRGLNRNNVYEMHGFDFKNNTLLPEFIKMGSWAFWNDNAKKDIKVRFDKKGFKAIIPNGEYSKNLRQYQQEYTLIIKGSKRNIRVKRSLDNCTCGWEAGFEVYGKLSIKRVYGRKK